MALSLTVAAFNDQLVTVQVDLETSVGTLKAILEAELQVPVPQQLLVHGTQLLREDSKTLGGCGISDGDVLQMERQPSPVAGRGTAAGPQGAGGSGSVGAGAGPPAAAMAHGPDGSLLSPAAFVSSLKADPNLMSQLKVSNPKMAKAIDTEDYAVIQDMMRQVNRQRMEQQAALDKEQEMLEADPFDPEAQRKIEEFIHNKNIEENYAHAMEHTPEVFAQVHMLYVNMEVNGHPVKAFIDSGAQMSIMTQDFANKCHIGNLVDKRFQGMAVGVGSSKIIGKVHQAPAKVGGQFITTSITVLEQKSGPQFIFGLDNLRRHMCCIDLGRQVLTFGSCNAELPFLSDSQIPKDFSAQIEEKTEEEAAKSMAEAERAPGGASGAAASGVGPSGTLAAPAPAPAAATQQPPAPAPPAAAAPPPTAAASPADEKLSQLMALGYSQEQASSALQQAGGNVEAAAAVLAFGPDAML